MVQIVRSQPKHFPIRHGLTWVVIIGLFALLLSAAFQSLDYHRLGIGIGANLVLDYVAPQSPAAGAGLKKGDAILEIDGQPVYTHNRFTFLHRRYKASKEYTLTVRHTEGTIETYQVVGKREDITTASLPSLIGLAFLTIGTLVYLLTPRTEPSWLFFLSTVALAFSYGSVYARSPWPCLLEDVAFFVPSLIVHFLFVFPVRRQWISSFWHKALLYLPGSILFVLSLLMTLSILRVEVFYNRAFAPRYEILGAAIGLGILIYTFATAKKPVLRQQIKWIIWGLGIAILFNGTYHTLERIEITRGWLSIDLVNWVSLIVPLALAFSIIRYRLFDIDTVINRSVVYTILALSIMVVYFASIYALTTLNVSLNYNSPGFVAMLVVLFSILLDPLRQQVQKLVDRVMYRHRPNYRQALQDLSHEMAATIDLEHLLSVLLSHLSRVTGSDHIQIFLFHSPDNEYRRVTALGPVQDSSPLSTQHPLIQSLQTEEEILRMPDITEPAPFDSQVLGTEAFMQRESLILCIPVRAHDVLLGWLGFGVPKDGRLYSLDERHFLVAVADQAAVAIQNALLYRESQDRSRQLSILYHIANVLTSTLDLQDLLRRFLAELGEIFAVETSSVMLIDPDGQDIVFQAAVGSGDDILPGVRIPLTSRSIAALVADTGEPVLSNDVQSDPRWYSEIDRLTGFSTRQLICVPILRRENVCGVIEILNRQDKTPFTAQDLALMTSLAAQASIAIGNAQLYTSTDHALANRVHELSTMQQIDRQLNATLDFDKVMDLTLQWAINMTKADAGSVGLVVDDAERQGIWIAAMRGYPLPLEHYQRELWPMRQGSIGQAAANAQVINRSSVHPPEQQSSARSELAVPVMRENRVIGVLGLESNRSDGFGKQDETFLVRLADHAAIAMENARLYQQVRQANESKSTFVSLVSHELKAPMTVIKGYTELLELSTAELVGDEEHTLLRMITASVERMQNLINELLQLAHLESGRLKLNCYPIPFYTTLAEVMTSFRRSIQEQELTISVDIPSDLPHVYADPVRFNEILTNLISNAIKYTLRGKTIQVEATVHPQHQVVGGQVETKDFVCCTVRDTGIGMSPEDQRLLFTRFFRSSHPHVRSQPGTGLGLSITKMLIEMHGGKIWAESKLGEGSSFSFTIPAIEQET
jgi:signal transduction histidine kinase